MGDWARRTQRVVFQVRWSQTRCENGPLARGLRRLRFRCGEGERDCPTAKVSGEAGSALLQAGHSVISLSIQLVGPWSLAAVVFSTESRRILIPVHAIIGNAVPTSVGGRATLLNWKRQVAQAAKVARSGTRLDSPQSLSVSAGFTFHRPTHGNQTLDVENFLKPTFDGLAAGLFCDEDTDCSLLERFAYDDSGFRYLFVHRLPDAVASSDEGAGIVVSVAAPTGFG